MRLACAKALRRCIGAALPSVLVQQYWDWSWVEQMFYDLPAVIGQVLAITGAPKLHFVGHHLVSACALLRKRLER